MKWEAVDIIVGVIVGILLMMQIMVFVLRITDAPAPDAILLTAQENFVLSVVSIISLYVGSRLNRKKDDK